MNKVRKDRLLKVFLCLLFVSYFFIASRPLEKELMFKPEWVRDVNPGPASEEIVPPAGEDVFSFRLGKVFGYYLASGTLVFSREASDNVAISDRAWAEYGTVPAPVSVFSPWKEKLCEIQDPSFPFIQANRLFTVPRERSGLSEYDFSGKLLYSRDFSSTITAFDANDYSEAVGLLEGRIELLGRDGTQAVEFSPGGSRIPVTLGTALSGDTRAIAAITGADPQRLILLERKNDGFQVVYHQYLSSDFRRSIPMAFSRDGAHVLFEQENELAVFSRTAKKLMAIPVPGVVKTLDADGFQGLVYVLTTDSNGACVTAVRPPDIQVFRVTYPGSSFFLRVDGEIMTLGIDRKLVKLSVSEG